MPRRRVVKAWQEVKAIALAPTQSGRGVEGVRGPPAQPVPPSSALRAPSPRWGEGDGERRRRVVKAWQEVKAIALAPTQSGRGVG